ncbi:MAG: SAM-dependent methyltransferase [Deltaproteobacteria bacterium HGW-Deltaproteobacteria-4]|nr:MAG: SAM-dependent methyltransferase [Deltaproteobacteria bacterium HGW-Deltaproteobacteria-4]
MTKFLSHCRKVLWQLSVKGLERGPHITRYFMYERLCVVAADFNSHLGRVLSISRSTSLVKLLQLQPDEVVEADYPEYNVLDLAFEDASFDFILLDQVLEHVEGSPQQAIDECLRVLKPGGVMVLTTCFMNPVHAAPGDYWRFTSDALCHLCRQFSKIIDCDGWGNFETWLLVRDGLRWEGIPHATWHPLNRLARRNDPEWPIVTWIVAQK